MLARVLRIVLLLAREEGLTHGPPCHAHANIQQIMKDQSQAKEDAPAAKEAETAKSEAGKHPEKDTLTDWGCPVESPAPPLIPSFRPTHYSSSQSHPQYPTPLGIPYMYAGSSISSVVSSSTRCRFVNGCARALPYPWQPVACLYFSASLQYAVYWSRKKLEDDYWLEHQRYPSK